MKYLIATLKYIKNNILILWPFLAVAILCFVPIIDYGAMERVAASFEDGKITSSFGDWVRLFIPFNTENWITVVLCIAAYVALILNLAFVHSMVDKHVRFGSKNFRSIMSSFTINFVYGFIFMAVIIALMFIFALLMAVVMSTFALGGAYIFVIGAVICFILAMVFIFIVSHLFLWLPCAEVTGYRVSEALYCSYAQAKTVRLKIITAVAIPFAAAVLITGLCAAFLGIAGTLTAGSISFGCAFMIIAVEGYLTYADVDGIEREDLRKY